MAIKSGKVTIVYEIDVKARSDRMLKERATILEMALDNAALRLDYGWIKDIDSSMRSEADPEPESETE